jgi:hypothetical protein
MAMVLLDMNCRVVIYSAADHLINAALLALLGTTFLAALLLRTFILYVL